MTAPRCTQAPQRAAAEAAKLHRGSVPVLETDRLRLRAPIIEDLPAWTAIFEGRDAKHIGGPFEDPAATAWEEFAYYTGCWMLYGHGLWSIERKSDAAHVGFIHLAIEWDDWEPELGWHLNSDARGQGFATEAGHAAVAFGRDLLGTFVSYIHPENTASQGVAKRLGARRDPEMERKIEAVEGDPTQVWRHGGDA